MTKIDIKRAFDKELKKEPVISKFGIFILGFIALIMFSLIIYLI